MICVRPSTEQGPAMKGIFLPPNSIVFERRGAGFNGGCVAPSAGEPRAPQLTSADEPPAPQLSSAVEAPASHSPPISKTDVVGCDSLLASLYGARIGITVSTPGIWLS